MGLLTGKKVLMVLPPSDFCDEEFFKSRVVLQAQGAIVTTTSIGVEETTGIDGGKARIDISLPQVHAGKYDALVFIGGKGSKVYFRDKAILSLVKDAIDKQKVVGAICVAGQILANAGILKGKKVTEFSKNVKKLQMSKGIIKKDAVVTDGLIITAANSSDAENFGEQLAHLLATK